MTAPPTDDVVHRPDPDVAAETNVRAFMDAHDIPDHDALIERTTTDLPGVPASGLEWFWDELIDHLDVVFDEPYDRVRDDARGPQFTDWYPGGRLNAARNALDRHARERPEAVACVWEGEPGDTREVTFGDLGAQADRVASYLDARGVGVGDTVALYMPMVPEVVAILYGCLRAGAIAVPIFSGFGADAAATRIADAEASVLFTADGFHRRGEAVDLKTPADDAIGRAGHVEHVVVHERLAADTPWVESRDERWADAIAGRSAAFTTRSLPSDAPAMLLYSSGTTGKPKGIVQTHAGALVQAAKELHFGFDLKPDDRFFWLSDIGWMMGPWTLLGNHHFGNTVFMYEGAPDHPDPDRLWAMIDRHDLTHFGISPTAIRGLREAGEEWLDGHDLSSLRILGSTGEPWDRDSWLWFHEAVGGGDLPIINISGGTEIFGCFLMPMPTQELKPCTLGGPGLGMDVDIVDEDGESVRAAHERGHLVARDSCPSMTKSLWSGDERYLREYWSTWPDLWDHGDWAQMDEDGLWYLHGRADDALNVAGRKVGPAEVEGAAIEHPAVSQAAAVGVPDETTGTAVVCYVVLEPDHEPSEALREAIGDAVADRLGKPFRPREVRFVEELPTTQSGKIVRRAIAAAHRGEAVGDLSSVENPEALAAIERAR